MGELRDDRDKPIFIHSVLDDLGLDPYTFRVYARLARRGDRSSAWESIASMAEGCCMSEKKVRDALTELEKRRMLRRKERPGKTSIYILTDAPEWQPLADPTPVRSDTPSRSDTPTPVGSDRPPLADPTDEGTPLKEELREEEEERAREVESPDEGDEGGPSPEQDLAFLGPADLEHYRDQVQAVLAEYPDAGAADRLWARLMPRGRPTMTGTRWLLAHAERGAPWPQLVTALVVTTDQADTPNTRYAERVLESIQAHAHATPRADNASTTRPPPGRRAGHVQPAGADEAATGRSLPSRLPSRAGPGAGPPGGPASRGGSGRSGGAGRGGRPKRDGELSNYEYLLRCGYSEAEAAELCGPGARAGSG